MGEISEGLEQLLYTQPVPSTTANQLRALLRWERGSTRQVAALLGVSQRTVQRWVTRKAGSSRRPSARHEQTIADLVRARWQPRVRARRRAEAEERGVVVHTRARFGFRAGAGSSDDPRLRLITAHLPGAVTREMFAALEAGAGEKQHELILSRALGHAYFRGSGQRAHGLQVVLGDIDFIGFALL
ncbi:telomere-protecting terminal protein Tpg [Streptomyces laculatispora]|uniref:telomere-protecting terminal protein Tpg n=1 Tax=Streptomyces laculatispora TaxID=887464 RepID=UPI001A94722D|nr:helix-turn-helix domain-containing protein [Streptomyces laculatispora]MBO0916737.1 helix-turn-helix domain-containing protein [Streptomyces laculatispora]